MEHPYNNYSVRQKRKWLDPRVALLESSRNSARAKGLDHLLKKSDIIIPEHCPVFGYKLKAGGTDFNSMSLDRLDNDIGYLVGNVNVVSMKANRLKSNASIEELEKLLSYMKLNQK
jgi:hypothetical protein